jgi:hypothetical protein
MNVCVRVLFESPGLDELARMRSLAGGLTDSADSVRVFAAIEPGWLVAEFTMTRQTQDAAVAKIDWAMRFRADDRMDSVIFFPKSEEERARAARRAEQRRARRKGL